jgi:hypothetical protein|nr:MAG TPA: hypothetical protein [Bacteriophage sp.]
MKTIQELVIKTSKVTMSVEDKKVIAKTLSLLFSKSELEWGLAWCYGEFENDLLESNNDSNWEPTQNSFYDICNILLYLLDMKTFKQVDDWEEVYRAIATRLFY